MLGGTGRADVLAVGADRSGRRGGWHACVSRWLNGGVPAPQVTEWAGHSVEVLLKVYAKCLDGQDAVARRRVEQALGHSARPSP